MRSCGGLDIDGETVAEFALGGDFQHLLATVQGGRRDAPVAVAVRLGAAYFTTVGIQLNDCTRPRSTRDRRGVVVSAAAIAHHARLTLIVVDSLDTQLRSCGGLDIDGETVAEFALGGDFQHLLAIVQSGTGDAPVAVTVGLGATYFTTVGVQLNDRARPRGARDRRGVVVCAAAIAHHGRFTMIIVDAFDDRLDRCRRLNSECEDVAVLSLGFDAKDIQPFWKSWGDGPVPLCIGLGKANGTAAGKNLDIGVGSGSTGQGWRFVADGRAVLHLTRFAFIVDNTGNDWTTSGSPACLHRNNYRFAHFAVSHNGQNMRASAEIAIRSEAPVSFTVRLDTTDQFSIVIYIDVAVDRRTAAQLGSWVDRDVAVINIASVVNVLINYLRNESRRIRSCHLYRPLSL